MVDIDVTNKGGSALGTVATAAPAYATTVLGQPLQQAQAATDAIVKKNLAD
jgi:membrane fusion protein (multidrug efflux system)